MNNFRPCLTPNFPVGEYTDWRRLLGRVSNWVISEKLDGVRIELFSDKIVKTRALKHFRSKKINEMGVKFRQSMSNYPDILLEAEIWSPELTFEEIKSFVAAEDITSLKHRKKLESELRRGEWKFPGRDIEFMTTWPDSLKFYVFDSYNKHKPNLNKLQRIQLYKEIIADVDNDDLIPIKHIRANSLNYINNWYYRVLEQGGEGLMIVKGSAPYKFGRFTVKQHYAYKMKDNNKPYNAVILGVEEGTIVDSDVPTGINELGYSTTSQSIFDRMPSGKAKGLKCKVRVEGKMVTQIVSLSGFNDRDKVNMLNNDKDWIDKTITIVGMKPTKIGGKVRSAFYVK